MTTTPNLWRAFTDNATLFGVQESPDVAATAGDQFFAVWVDFTNFNGGLQSIVARKFDSLGNPLTGDVLLDPGFTDETGEAAAVRLPIAGQADGLAVAFTDTSADDIFLVRTNANLVPIDPGGLITIDSTPAITNHPSITSFSDGSLWVAYTRQNSSTNWEIDAQRVDANGTLVGTPIILAGPGVRVDDSALATLANGNVVAVFDDQVNNNFGNHDIFYTIRTSTGTNVVSPTAVADTSDNEFLPHVAALADGGFAVTWTDPTTHDVRASVYDASGGLVHPDILVNLFIRAPNFSPSVGNNDVTALPDGGFIVTWESGNGNQAQRFDEAGNLVGTEIIWASGPNADAATYSDGRAILTSTIDNLTGPNLADLGSSIFDSRATDANQTTGANFFDGSGADLFLIRDIGGVRQLEAITNGTATVFGTVGTNQHFVGSGDFNGDGLSDLLINVDNPGAGTRTFLVDQMNPGGIQTQVQIAVRGPDWIVDGTGDFNHDGTSDILVHRDLNGIGTRTLEVMVMHNNVVQSNTTIGVTGTDWQVDAIGDFNGNGTSDILQHQISGGSMTLRDLVVNNVAVTSAPTLAVRGANWQVDGIGDFNHDGTSDVLMHQDSGGVRTLQVLTIQNNAVTSATTIAQIGTNISVGGIGDFNGDGTSDFLVHQDVGTTRTDIVYNVVNNTVVNTHTVAVTGIDWHVA